MKLTAAGKALQSNGILSAYYTNFIGECKNYNKKVGVTYVGKFCSLMLTTGCTLGILFFPITGSPVTVGVMVTV